MIPWPHYTGSSAIRTVQTKGIFKLKLCPSPSFVHFASVESFLVANVSAASALPVMRASEVALRRHRGQLSSTASEAG